MSAAARPRPSAMPPAANTGVGATASTTAGTSGKVDRSAPCPPASVPCATMMSAPAALAARPSSTSCTWQISVQPASLMAGTNGPGLTCSQKTDPVTMRVRTSQMGRRRTLDEEEAHSRADRPQAAPGGGRTGRRDFGPRGRKETRHKRGDLPPLAQPLWWHEGRCDEAPQGARGRERPPEEDRRRPGGGHRHPKGGEPGKLLSPTRKRAAVEHVRRQLGVSERRACSVIAQPRSSQRYEGRKAERDRRLAERMVTLSRENPRYGYRRVWALLRREGWPVNKKRVHRLWRQEGLKVAQKQRKRQRLLLGESENGCTRRRAEHKDHVWSYDFVMELTEDGRRLKMMPVVDEYTRECLSIDVERSITADDVIETLAS